MKRMFFSSLLCVAIASSAFSQEPIDLKEKLKDFFFGLSIDAPLAELRQQLSSNPHFKPHSDPNRDPGTSIVGSFTEGKNLNPLATRNQFIASLSSAGSKLGKTSFTWFIDYRLEDLASTIYDYEKMKSDFKPIFEDVTEKLEIGSHMEEINTVNMKKGTLRLTLRMLKYNNGNHTISIEYVVKNKKK